MVIPIAIGFYDKNAKNKEINGYLKDLDGVRIDIHNAMQLFGPDQLNYDLFPKFYYQQDINTYTAFWTENKLVQFLKDKAKDFEANLEQYNVNDKSGNRYDGLL